MLISGAAVLLRTFLQLPHFLPHLSPTPLHLPQAVQRPCDRVLRAGQLRRAEPVCRNLIPTPLSPAAASVLPDTQLRRFVRGLLIRASDFSPPVARVAHDSRITSHESPIALSRGGSLTCCIRQNSMQPSGVTPSQHAVDNYGVHGRGGIQRHQARRLARARQPRARPRLPGTSADSAL